MRDAGIYELHANMTTSNENVNGNENGENSVNGNENGVNGNVNEARSKEQQTTTAIAAFAIIVL